MGKAKRTILAAACAAALVVGSVAATVAYLTSTDTVTNTFTVGNVAITLDEAKVNDDGDLVKVGEDGKETVVQDIADATRVDANSYKLLPGHEYVKDPTVHFAAGSEASWLFVKVENGISAYESTASTYSSIGQQIGTNGWAQLTDADDKAVDGVYCREVSANTSAKAIDYAVFGAFAIADSANTLAGWSNISTETTKITVTAYAVQKDGFGTAWAAWNATFGATQSEPDSDDAA